MKFRSPLPLYISILSLIGIFFISISTQTEASLTIGNKYFFIQKQILWLTLGIFTFCIASKINLNFIKKYSFPFYLIVNFLLLIVLIPNIGTQALGAKRWLSLGPLGSLQPSELAKMIAIIFFPFLFSQEKNRNLKTLLIYLGVPLFLIILEPNLSTAVLLSVICLVIYYLSNAPLGSIMTFSFLSIIFFTVLTLISPYRFTRLKTLLNPNTNTTSTSYHSNQIIYALASGGIWGKGFANSNQKYKYLPKISTDSILAIIGEETGFIGISLIFYIYLLLVGHLFRIAKKIDDNFESLLVAGTGAWIAFQTIINIGAIANIIPLTGIPLPFISYGGSSLTSLFFTLGLVYNIEKKHYNLIYLNNGKENNNHRHPSHPRSRINRTIKRRQNY